MKTHRVVSTVDLPTSLISVLATANNTPGRGLSQRLLSAWARLPHTPTSDKMTTTLTTNSKSNAPQSLHHAGMQGKEKTISQWEPAIAIGESPYLHLGVTKWQQSSGVLISLRRTHDRRRPSFATSVALSLPFAAFSGCDDGD